MKSVWYAFIDDYQNELPYKSLSVILEAFYWYTQMSATTDEAYTKSCNEKIETLMTK